MTMKYFCVWWVDGESTLDSPQESLMGIHLKEDEAQRNLEACLEYGENAFITVEAVDGTGETTS